MKAVWRAQKDQLECLRNAYPDRVRREDRYLAYCQECKLPFTANHRAAKTCGSTCRQRQKRRLDNLPKTEKMF